MVVPVIRRKKIEVEHKCKNCKHGYFADFDSTGWHNLCGAGYCYLCHQRDGGECYGYEAGPVPEGKELL